MAGQRLTFYNPRQDPREGRGTFTFMDFRPDENNRRLPSLDRETDRRTTGFQNERGNRAEGGRKKPQRLKRGLYAPLIVDNDWKRAENEPKKVERSQQLKRLQTGTRRPTTVQDGGKRMNGGAEKKYKTSVPVVDAEKLKIRELQMHRRKVNYGKLERERNKQPKVQTVLDFQLGSELIRAGEELDLNWEEFQKNTQIVDKPCDLRAMVDLVRDVPFVTLQIQTSGGDLNKESVSLIKLGTNTFSFVIDTKAVPSLVETELGPVLENKLWVMVDWKEAVKKLIVEFNIFPKAVFDMGNFAKVTIYRDANAPMEMKYTSVIEEVLEQQYPKLHCARKTAFFKKTEWGARPLSQNHTQCAYSDVYYMLMAWKKLCSDFRPDELQHNGVDPSKDDIITPCVSQDERNQFETEFHSYLQRNLPERQQEFVDIKSKLGYLWELRELFASYHDTTPEGVMSFECLCGMITNILPSHEEFEGVLRNAGAQGHAGAMTLEHSRDIWRNLHGGKEKLDAILLRRCRTCKHFSVYNYSNKLM